MQRASPHGRAIVRALRDTGITIATIITVAPPSAWRNLRRTVYAEGLACAGLKMIRRAAAAPRRVLTGSDGAISGEIPCAECSSENAPDTVSALKAAAPDLLILGGCGIVGPAVLQIPSLGTLNAHPGWLPDYRGLSVVAWSLHNGETPGATVHWADAGVDTGAVIIRQRLSTITGLTLRQIESAVGDLAVALLAQAVQLIAKNRAPRIPQSPGAGRRYSRMPFDTRRRLELRLQRRGEAMSAGVHRSTMDAVESR